MAGNRVEPKPYASRLILRLNQATGLFRGTGSLAKKSLLRPQFVIAVPPPVLDNNQSEGGLASPALRANVRQIFN
jgi:hypothetical protein